MTISSGITANNKVYNGTTAATLGSNNVVLAGVVAGDSVILNTNGYVANFASAGVGNGVAVSVSGMTLGGGSAANYTLTQPAGLGANITAAPVTITSGITANNKVYNGTTAAALGSNNVVLAGVVAGDTVILNTNGYVANFASAGIGNGVAVSVSGMTLGGGSAANYTLTQPAGLGANITAAPVTITSGITANNKVYNGSTAAALGSNNVVLACVVSGDTVILNTNGYVANFACAGVGHGVAVSVSGMTLGRRQRGQLHADPTSGSWRQHHRRAGDNHFGHNSQQQGLQRDDGGDAQFQQCRAGGRGGGRHGDPQHQRLCCQLCQRWSRQRRCGERQRDDAGRRQRGQLHAHTTSGLDRRHYATVGGADKSADR